MIRLLNHSPTPYLGSKLSLLLSLPVCRWLGILTGKKGEGVGEEQNSTTKKILAFYKSSIFCCPPNNPLSFSIFNQLTYKLVHSDIFLYLLDDSALHWSLTLSLSWEQILATYDTSFATTIDSTWYSSTTIYKTGYRLLRRCGNLTTLT